MRIKFLIILCCVLSICSLSFAKEKEMKISSQMFENNGSIPAKYTCDGENVNPPLLFSDIPSNAKSLVLIVDDPDAPSGTWVHWIVWNIDAKTSEIRENSVPSGGMEGKTSFGNNEYGGPCPPSGVHHYFFKLYALDKKLDLPAKSDKSDLERAMQNHIVKYSELIGLYGKQ